MWILKLVHFEILNQFSSSSFEIRGFSLFNQKLLIYLTFQACFDLTLKQKYVKQYKQLKYNPEILTKH